MVIYPPFKTTLYCSMAAATRLRLKCQEHLKVKQTGVYALHFTLLCSWPFLFFELLVSVVLTHFDSVSVL